MGGKRKKGQKEGKKDTYERRSARHGGRLGAVAAMGGASRVVWVPEGIFGLFLFCCPSTWVVAIVKGVAAGWGRDRGEEGGGRQAGLVALLGRCQKNKTKHVFILSAPAWARERGREREAHTPPAKPPSSAAGLRPRPSAAAPAAARPARPGFACQARVGTAPPAAPNKAVTHPRAGADSKQSDRRIFRMLIQMARRRTSHKDTPPPPPTPNPPLTVHPPPDPRTPPLAPAGLVRGWRSPRRRESRSLSPPRRAEAALGGQTRPLGICCTCSRCLHLALEP